jgi:hypothetical protein
MESKSEYNKKWRKNNPEKVKIQKQRYKEKDERKFRENHKKYQDTYKKHHPESIAKTAKEWKNRNVDKVRLYANIYRKTIKCRFNTYKNRAKKRNFEFEITFEDFNRITSTACHYCKDSEAQIGIDRKNNKKGYTLNNSLPCCWSCNKMKGSKTYEEMINFIVRIRGCR